MRPLRTIIIVLLAVTLLPAVHLSAGPVRAITRSTSNDVAAAGGSFMPSFSPDGRFLFFLSHANNLVTNDDRAPYFDIFMRDLVASNTTLVSVNLSGVGGGNDNSILPVASSNAQFVAYESAAGNFVPNDTNGTSDVFLRDTLNQTAALVSVNAFGRAANGASGNAAISADGRWIAFDSRASDLVTNDANGQSDVFVRDMVSGVTTLVSVDAAGALSGNGRSETPQMSADGHRILFFSTATNLVAGVTNVTGELYLRDLESNETLWITANSANSLTNNSSPLVLTNWMLSANGHAVVFTYAANSFNPAAFLFYFDVDSRMLTLISSALLRSDSSLLSADGRSVFFSTSLALIKWNSETGSRSFVRQAVIGGCDGGIGPMEFFSPEAISPDARFVLYRRSSCLQGSPDAFDVQDLALGTINWVNQTADGHLAPITLTSYGLRPNGAMVAFESPDNTGTPGDLNKASDIFLHDLSNTNTELISRSFPSNLPATDFTLSSVTPHGLSADGSVFVCSRFENDSAPNDTNSYQNLFACNLASGMVVPISFLPSIRYGTQVSDPIARAPSISSDGRYVAFVSESALRRFISGQYVSPFYDVYLRDMLQEQSTRFTTNIPFSSDPARVTKSPVVSPPGSFVAFESRPSPVLGAQNGSTPYSALLFRMIGTNQLHGTNYVNPLVSINRTNNGNGNGDSVRPFVSPNSRWLLFYSSATDLTLDLLAANYSRLFARDLSSSQLGLLSYDQTGSPLNDQITNGVFSAYSRFVFFEAPGSASIYRCELLSRFPTNLLVCTGCSNPSPSGDGRFVAYQSRSGNSSVTDVFVKDLQTGATTLQSIARSGISGGNGDSTSGQLSADARYVVFASKASNLVENDTNNCSDIFVRDRLLGATLLISANRQGTASANAVSSHPILGADGRTVVFQSFASDLVSADYNSTRDVFVLQLAGVDSDHDGMDDDWEMTYFSTLARNGLGDVDHDGQSDLDEFRAGTDPTDSGSIFRVLTLRRLSGSGVTLLWSAVPGRTYTIQFKNSVDAPAWSNLAENVRAASTTGSFLDNTPAQPQQFYRVILAESFSAAP
jgi:Tol biopolymer transport system component